MDILISYDVNTLQDPFKNGLMQLAFMDTFEKEGTTYPLPQSTLIKLNSTFEEVNANFNEVLDRLNLTYKENEIEITKFFAADFNETMIFKLSIPKKSKSKKR